MLYSDYNHYGIIGVWERDMQAGTAMEKASFEIMNKTDEEERLELFDKHMSYFIFT